MLEYSVQSSSSQLGEAAREGTLISKLAIVALAALALASVLVMACGQTAADLGDPYSANDLMAAYNDSSDAYEADWMSKRVNVIGTVDEVSGSRVYLQTNSGEDAVALNGLSDEALDEVAEGELVEFACVIGEFQRGVITMSACGPAEHGGESAASGSSDDAGAGDTGGASIIGFLSVPLLLIAAALTAVAIARSNWAGMQPAMIALMFLGVLALLNSAAVATGFYRGLDVGILNILALAGFPFIAIMGLIIIDPNIFYFLPPWLTGVQPEPEPPPPPVFTETTSAPSGDMGATAVGPAGGTVAPASSPSATMAMQPDVARSMAWVVVTRGPSEGKSIQLKEGNNTIGRAFDSDLQIEDASVSRSHAMVSVKGEEFTLIDLGSAGGTRIGEYRIAGRRVSEGAEIAVGNTRLRLISVDVAHGAPSSGDTIVGSTSGHSLSLIAQSGPDAGKSFLLSAAQNVIGRDPTAQVSLSDPTVSRQHAMVRVDAAATSIADLGSMSGTAVNGEVIKGVRISVGDRIVVGQSEFTLMKPSV